MPTGYTPLYKIMKGGIDITDHFNDRTIAIEVVLGGNAGNDTCKITVDDRDWRVAAVEVGAKLEIYLGYREVGLAQMGIFRVATVDYVINPKQIEITGTSIEFSGALKTPAIRQFEKKKLGEVLKEIGALTGAEVYVDPSFRDVELPFINQMSSPLHLLHELGRRFGAIAKFENGKLIFAKQDEGESTEGVEIPVMVIRPQDLTRGFVRHADRSKYDGVQVGWFDENHVKHYHTERDPNADVEADGEDQGDNFLSKLLGRNEAEARFLARSQMAGLRRQQGEAHLIMAKGNPWIRDQQRILMREFRDGVNGSYVNDTVTHTYVKDPGLSTEILAKPPGDGADYDDLDEETFVKLGTNGVVGLLGPEQPQPITKAPEPKPDETPAPVEIDDPVNL